MKGERPDRRLHRLRHARQPASVLDLRQHARLRGGADRQHDGPVDSQLNWEGSLTLIRPIFRTRRLLPESPRRTSRLPPAIPPSWQPRLARRSPRLEGGAIPERCCPQIYKMGMPTVIFGNNPRTNQQFIPITRFDIPYVPTGGLRRRSGGPLVKKGAGCNMDKQGTLDPSRATGEINESIFPVRTPSVARLRHRQRRPGQVARLSPTPRSSRKCAPSRRGAPPSHVGSKYPMPGMPAASRARRTSSRPLCVVPRPDRSITTAFYVTHGHRSKKATALRLRRRWRLGHPLDRDPQAVLDDVLDEYVSVEGAHRDYGVVLTGTAWMPPTERSTKRHPAALRNGEKAEN